MRLRIQSVQPGSVGEELGLAVGDFLIQTDGRPVKDALDYRIINGKERFTLTVEKPAETVLYEVDKSPGETLGLHFSQDGLTPAPCKNACVFCFADQLPGNFACPKNDDWRHSVLYGHPVSLTNLQEEDYPRLAALGLPLTVSVHTTNPALREKIMGNKNAGRIMAQLQRLCEHGVDFYALVTLVPEWNDGFYLRQTFEDLLVLHPHCKAMIINPVVLTIHRRGRQKLKKVTPAQAEYLLDDITRWQKKCRELKGTPFIYPADRFYLLAGRPLPPAESYPAFIRPQKSPGRLPAIKEGLDKALPGLPPWITDRRVSLVCGTGEQDFWRSLCARLQDKYPNLTAACYPVRNFCLGESVTETALVAGRDIGVQLEGAKLGSELFVCQSMLTGERFIDNVTLPGLSQWLGLPITALPEQGEAFARCLLGLRSETENE